MWNPLSLASAFAFAGDIGLSATASSAAAM
jgi:hypothetical protein